jgi:hypothetical protein
MAKATSRKHATHKKARAHHAAKPHARRSSVTRPASGEGGPAEPRVEPEIVDEDFTPRSEIRTVDDDSEEEVGIYGPNRGETAG